MDDWHRCCELWCVTERVPARSVVGDWLLTARFCFRRWIRFSSFSLLSRVYAVATWGTFGPGAVGGLSSGIKPSVVAEPIGEA